jgi:hypothetical protein
MARLARVVVPGEPHHVTQCGNRGAGGEAEAACDEAALTAIPRSRSTGRPVGSPDWIKALEAHAGQPLAAGRRGPRPKTVEAKAAVAGLFRTASPEFPRYFTSMIEAVQWAAPLALMDHEFEFNGSMEPRRRLSEILEAEHTLFRQVWYNRHWNARFEIEAGKVKVIRDGEWTAEKNQSAIIQSVWRTAMAAAQRTEEEFGKDKLGPWSDFE